jgi:hypothetical protein
LADLLAIESRCWSARLPWFILFCSVNILFGFL